MKCTNTNFKCSGEMKPLFKSPNLTECVKCGFRIETPKEIKKVATKEVAPKEVESIIKETN
jgi:hypothetical protein